jgi:hemoglobin/transferrin/lactoferrin receptor protein
MSHSPATLLAANSSRCIQMLASRSFTSAVLSIAFCFAFLAAHWIVPSVAVAQDAAVANEAAPAPTTGGDAAEGAAYESSAGEPEQPAAEGEEPRSFFFETTVTATLSEVDAFAIPQSVSVIENIEDRSVDNVAELIVTEPGVAVNGVGVNQVRPIIRGQRGLRVLFLEDGLSLNNPRRQSDFGEITGLVDLEQAETVEVVRGPASVLYGSGAIGGVLNVLTKNPPSGSGRDLRGGLAVRASSADEQEKVSADVGGYNGRWSWSLQASRRDAEDYEAPSGTFGDVTLDDDATVFDTGVEDDHLRGTLGFELSARQQLRFTASRYSADQFGFGFVDPGLLDPEFDGTQTRILYPYQDFERYTVGWTGGGFQNGAVDSFDVRLYRQSNERELVFDADINIGPVFPRAPDSSLQIDTLNFTDLDTTGLRAEMAKMLTEKQRLTWGVDYTVDDLFNTDNLEQTITFRFPFPPSTIGLIPGFTCVDFVPPFECSFTDVNPFANTPNAENVSLGLFVQDEIFATERFRAIVGARYQNVETNAEPTPGRDVSGLDFDDDQLVGAVNALYAFTDNFEVVGSVGTAFRAPSIVERLFNGLTPEGLGYQILNPELESETSEYFDLGVKYRVRKGFFNAVYFENRIDDGIVQDFLSPAEIAQLPAEIRSVVDSSGVQFVVQQRNIDRTTVEGLELAGGISFGPGLTAGANYTWLDGRREDSDNPPNGDVAGDSYNAYLRWDRPRFSVEYRFRHDGEEPAVLEPGDPVPVVGEVLPSFTVHSLNAFGTVWEGGIASHQVGLMVANLTDELYAELSNIGSFRPQPGRNFVLTYRLRLR